MLIRPAVWESIRTQFGQHEKDLINTAYSGETLCPRGVVVNMAMLPAELQGKLRAAVEGVKA